MPTICTLVKIWIVPSNVLSADGPLRTFSWEVACPSTGAIGWVGVGGAAVTDGGTVCVGGRVAVMMTGVAVGEAVAAIALALQAVFSSKRDARVVRSRERMKRLCSTAVLYPSLLSLWRYNNSKQAPLENGFSGSP